MVLLAFVFAFLSFVIMWSLCQYAVSCRQKAVFVVARSAPTPHGLCDLCVTLAAFVLKVNPAPARSVRIICAIDLAAVHGGGGGAEGGRKDERREEGGGEKAAGFHA